MGTKLVEYICCFSVSSEPVAWTLCFLCQGTVIIIANHGDRIDIPSGALLENKIVSGNLRILQHWMEKYSNLRTWFIIDTKSIEQFYCTIFVAFFLVQQNSIPCWHFVDNMFIDVLWFNPSNKQLISRINKLVCQSGQPLNQSVNQSEVVIWYDK